MTQMVPEILTDFELLEEHEFAPPCDLGRMRANCDRPAEWIMYCAAACCTHAADPRLACTECKDTRMTSELAVECPGCGHVIAPARHAYSRIEPLKKKS
jgi:hypothetical protein